MGASSGIGRAAALKLAAEGAAVVCSARNEAALEILVDEIRRNGGAATGVAADVSDFEQVKAVAARAVADFGRIDTWVHSAAVTLFSTFEQTRPEEFKRVLEVNLLGQIHGALAALPHLRARGQGSLIVISSVEGLVSLPFQSAYAASKHGVVGFLCSLRLELEREGVPISVVNIVPATIDTPLYQNALTRLGVEPRGPSPVYDPEIVADAIVHAAAHPVRSRVVGGGGLALILAHRLSPRLADAILMTRIGFESQLTTRPKSLHAANNLFSPSPDETAKVHGDLGAEAISTSIATRLQTSAPARWAEMAARPLRRAAARIVETVWALRFHAGLADGSRGRPGGGLPLPIQEERTGVAAIPERKR